MKRARLLFALPLLFTACHSSSDSPSSATPPATATPSATPSPNAAASANGPGPAAAPSRIRWLTAPEGLVDATDTVKAAYAREHADGRTLLVYVGATWCEPCQRFHHAVDSGQLDASFPKLTFLAFDADKDGEALANGGYYSRLIPLIAIPNADGKASGRQIEGGIKGDGTVAFITTKLQGLLSGGS